MTYQETLDWLFSQFQSYQKVGKTAYKADLSNIIALSHHIGNPHQCYKSIHVAGTNGKGSSSHMLASVLQEAGYKVGLYTSPHLKDFRERIKINGIKIPEKNIMNFVAKHKLFFERNEMSFFEMTVGMAFDYFAVSNVDIAVIEVGLGGRLDATNIIVPEVSLITNIGKDHTAFLGNDLKSIATEKAGVIKANIPVVISEYQQDVASVFTSKAKAADSKLTFADQCVYEAYKTDLQGLYQSKNVKGVIAVLHQLIGFDVSKKSMKLGLQNVIKNTNLLGRWQIIQEQPKVICDTAHNKEGLSIVMRQLSSELFEQLHIVFGVVSDKDLNSILPLLPQHACYYFCAPKNLRGLAQTELQVLAKSYGLKGDCYNSVNEAFMMSKQKASKGDVIYVGGSTFVVAEIL